MSIFLEECNLVIDSNLKYVNDSKQFLITYGDIYNINSLKEDFKLKDTDNPNEIILSLYNYFLENNDSIDAIKNIMLATVKPMNKGCSGSLGRPTLHPSVRKKMNRARRKVPKASANIAKGNDTEAMEASPGFG